MCEKWRYDDDDVYNEYSPPYKLQGNLVVYLQRAITGHTMLQRSRRYKVRLSCHSWKKSPRTVVVTIFFWEELPALTCYVYLAWPGQRERVGSKLQFVGTSRRYGGCSTHRGGLWLLKGSEIWSDLEHTRSAIRGVSRLFGKRLKKT